MKGKPHDPEARRARLDATLAERLDARATELYPEYRRLLNETALGRVKIAQALGVSRATLGRLEERWGIRWVRVTVRPVAPPGYPGGAGKDGSIGDD